MMPKLNVTLLFVFVIFKLQSQQSIIAATDTKVFYTGMPNPISVILNGVNPMQLAVKGINCELSGKNGNYNVTVIMNNSRTCKVKAGMVRQNIDTLWMKEEEFKIRPRPTIYINVNGKDGGNITKSEMLVWNFMNVSFGPNFSKDGYQMRVIDFKITCQTKSHEFTAFAKSPAISDSIKKQISQLQEGDYVFFHDIRIANNFNTDTVTEITGPAFKLVGYSVANTIHNFGVTPNNTFSRGIYSYRGNWVDGKKDGFWSVTLANYPDIKVGESMYKQDTLVNKKIFYYGADIMTDTKFDYSDTLAFITAYYMNGTICYKGSYKIDAKYDAFLNDEGEDRLYYDTSSNRSKDRYEIDRDVLVKPLTGEWQFFYENGNPAAKGQFSVKLRFTPLSDKGTPNWYHIVTRDGKWKYYRTDGSIFLEVLYDNGYKMTETFFIE